MRAFSFFLFLLGASAQASAPSLCGQPLASPFTYGALQARIQSCEIGSIAELLPQLPAEYLENYVLLNFARGLQKATSMAPRAILFGRDARTVVAYNGAPEEAGFNELEVMEYKPDTQHFELHSISFPPGAKPQFSEANPSRCVGCHGETDPKPNWDGYLLWPGSYGAEDEATFISYRTHDRSSDSADFEKFVAGGKSAPLYKLLRPFAENHETETANTNLGDRLQRLNFRRVARHVAEDAKLGTFRYALQAAITCGNMGEDIRTFIPAKLLKAAPHDLTWYRADTLRRQNQGFLARVARLKAQYPSAPEGSRVIDVDKEALAGKDTMLSDSEVPAALRFVVEGLAGESMAGWSSEFDTSSVTFNSGTTDISFLEFPLVEALFAHEPDVQAMYRIATWEKIDWVADPYPQNVSFYTPSDKNLCAVLRKKSLAALGK